MNEMKRFSTHNHSEFSNLRLLDATCKPKDLVDRAIELGLAGLAITEHESVASHFVINQYNLKLQDKYPEFKVGLGNEIYLVDDRENVDKYYHFILIAKDKIGHDLLQEQSSIAWYYGKVARGLWRVPTEKKEIEQLIAKYGEGHLIATTACIGGELGTNLLKLHDAERMGNIEGRDEAIANVRSFLDWCIKTFKDDFYLEIAAAANPEQEYVNSKIKELAQSYNLKIVIGDDTHYLRKEDRFVHKAFLNSKDGDREVDEFYQFCYMMDDEDIATNLHGMFDIEELYKNSLEIYDKIEVYDLSHAQTIPKVALPHIEKKNFDSTYPTLKKLFNSDIIEERTWVNKCYDRLVEKNLVNETYLSRLEEEAGIIDYIGEELNDCLFGYFTTFSHYAHIFWDCGSIVGPGRGSAGSFVSNWLLDITQVDPIAWGLPSFRFLNRARVELPDIDIDLDPTKREKIFETIREERGELGLIQVATFGTATLKSAINIACRGYRSEEYPDGIDIDTSQYIASLVPQERGQLWSLHDILEGNDEKGRKPSTIFINAVRQYPRLLDIIKGIEGLIVQRGVHASGVLLTDIDNPYKYGAIMRSPKGDLTTQYDLHVAEAAGSTKFDFLVTEISTKMRLCIELLQKDKVIDPSLTLHEAYNKYLHPDILDYDKPEIWEALNTGSVIDAFQFSASAGLYTVKTIRPQNINDMIICNVLMRLQALPGQEPPTERFLRLRADPKSWYTEMIEAGLTQKEIEILEKRLKPYYGNCLTQEDLMLTVMDVGYTLAESNAVRKTLAKKKMDEIPKQRELLYEKVPHKEFADYIWKIVMLPQLAYSFNKAHGLEYSLIGLQTIYLAIHFPAVYWNTACLTVNSGSIEDVEGKSTDYSKIAKAISLLQERGIKVNLPDVNYSDFGYRPNGAENCIYCGLKNINRVGDDDSKAIIENRPYTDLADFLNKVKINIATLINLIKSGAFDSLYPNKSRYEIMGCALWMRMQHYKRLNLTNMSTLVKNNLLPPHLTAYFEFNRYLKARCPKVLDSRAMGFLEKENLLTLVYQDGEDFVLDKDAWNDYYEQKKDEQREYISSHMNELLTKLEEINFANMWNDKAGGTISSWEMDSICFYAHEHELSDYDLTKYGIVEFEELDPDGDVEYYMMRKNVQWPIYHLSLIAGTVLAKNAKDNYVSILQKNGTTVNVRFSKEFFAMFDKQVSEIGEDGVKHIVDKSWFSRGTKIVVTGYRKGDDFVGKVYSKTPTHQLYKMTLLGNNNVQLEYERGAA